MNAPSHQGTETESRKCACVADSARECYVMRYHLYTYEERQEDDGDCECSCHDEYEEWMEDENDALEDRARG
jgi:hypothetical protein